MKILYATRAVFGPCEIRHRDPSRGRQADAAEGRTTTTRLCWHNDYKIKFADDLHALVRATSEAHNAQSGVK